MRKPRHDFFSDPKWPLPDPSLPFPATHTPSHNSTKEGDKISPAREVPPFDQALFDLSTKPKSINDSIEKLDAEGEEEHARVSDYDDMVEKARELLECALMEDEPKEEMVKGLLKVEERSIHDSEYGDLSDHTFAFNHYRILSREAKQFLINEVERTNLSYVSRKYGISPNNLYRWKKHCDRKVGAGRKVADQQMENMLVEWIVDELAKGRKNLTRKQIQMRAIGFSRDSSFKASKGWLERFIKRNKQLNLADYFGLKPKDPMTALQQLANSLAPPAPPEIGLEKDEGKKEGNGHSTRNSLRLQEMKLTND
jgi:hypothetical protein